MMIARTIPFFKMGKRLHPRDVYCGAIGVFESNSEFTREYVFSLEDGQEYARVYSRLLPSKKRQLYILHYPGKDNDEASTLDGVTIPLSEVYASVNEHIKTKVIVDDEESGSESESEEGLFTVEELEAAHKIFIVCESNPYWLRFRVNHFVMAMKDGAGVLTIEDSLKDRGYNLKPVLETLEAVKEKTVITYREWQWRFDWRTFIPWNCGHYVIAAILRYLMGTPLPSSFSIDQTVLDEHERLYQVGLRSVTDVFNSLYPGEELPAGLQVVQESEGSKTPSPSSSTSSLVGMLNASAEMTSDVLSAAALNEHIDASVPALLTRSSSGLWNVISDDALQDEAGLDEGASSDNVIYISPS